MVKRQEKTFLPTSFGDFHMYAYSESTTEPMPHIALVHKAFDPSKDVVTRMHSECLTGDIFGSKRCDCGEQLHESLRIIEESQGILLYLRQEGRGIGLLNKMKAYNHQDEGLDTVQANVHIGFGADERKYDIAMDIYNDLGVKRIHLITNNPAKLKAFEGTGITVVKRIPIIINANDVNAGYLKTKSDHMGHLLNSIN